MPLSRRRVEDEARAILEASRVRKPPVPVDKIARNLGIKLVYQRLNEADVSGFYYRKGTQRLIGVNASHPVSRRRFTIAHELGHAVLTSHDDLHVDRNFLLRNRNSGRGVERLEVEANAFAAELLMPAALLQARLRDGVDVDDPEGLRKLAEEFGVSIQALIIRLSNLPFIVVGTEPWVTSARS